MEISDIHVFPFTITCLLEGTLCDTGIPCTFYGENICSVNSDKQKSGFITFLNPKIPGVVWHPQYPGLAIYAAAK